MSELEADLTRAARALDAGDPQAAHAALAPHAERLADHARLATLWAGLLEHLPDGGALERALANYAQTWTHAPEVSQAAAAAAVRWCRDRPLEPPARREPVARAAAELLRRTIHATAGGRDARAPLHLALAVALTEIGPAVDDDALLAFETALTARPDDAAGFFDLARLHTLRGRYAKGQAASAHALSLRDAPAIRWNLALCATALGDGETAAAQWRALDHEAQVDETGEARVAELPPVEICLTPATRGLDGAPAGGPWQVEAAFVQPLSPAHGRLLHPTRLPGAADFDDVVLWDPRPLGFRSVDGAELPRLLALATLRRGRAATLPVAGRLPYPKALQRVDAALPPGCFVHPFDPPRRGPFTGKLVHPRTLDPEAARAALCAAAAAAEVTLEPDP